jgi:hypothetical protein
MLRDGAGAGASFLTRFDLSSSATSKEGIRHNFRGVDLIQQVVYESFSRKRGITARIYVDSSVRRGIQSLLSGWS